MKNADLKPVIDALQAIGQTKLPIPLAMRMAKLRIQIVEHAKVVEETRVGIWMACSNGAKEMKVGDPGIVEYGERLQELLDQEYATGDQFPLYVRENGTGPEYAWTENFKAGKIENIEPNVLFGLLPLVEFREIKVDGE